MLVTESIVTSGLTSPQKVIQEIVSFAVARGWTRETGGSVGVEHEKLNDLWDLSSPYGWLGSGDGDMYTLTSTGYGSQDLICRLERRGARIYHTMLTQEDYTVQQANPCMQNMKIRIQAYEYISTNNDDDNRGAGWAINDTTANTLYLYGDDTWIMAVLCIDGIYYTHMHFGSLQPIYGTGLTQLDTAGRQLMAFYDDQDIYYATNYYITNWAAYVYYGSSANDYLRGGFLASATNYSWTVNPRMYTFGYYYESEDKCVNSGIYANGDTKYLFEYEAHEANGSGTTDHLMPDFSELLNTNNFSGKRPMFKQVYFQERNDNGQFQPIAFSPVYFINFNGLSGADLLTYGTETYRVFPIGTAVINKGGIAVRTA